MAFVEVHVKSSVTESFLVHVRQSLHFLILVYECDWMEKIQYLCIFKSLCLM